MGSLRRASPSKRTPRRRRRIIIAITIPAVLIGSAVLWRTTLGRRSAPVPVSEPAAIDLSSPAPRPLQEITFAQGCLTSQCHTSMTSNPKKHEPVAHGACATCHAPDTGGHVYPILKPAEALCRTCHNVADTSLRRHMSMSEAVCTTCHDPHSSTSKGLLRGNSVDTTCAECHTPAEGSVRHAPYAQGRCDLCHQSHGTDLSVPINAASIEAACRLCHPNTADSMSHSSHAGVKIDRSCLACHAAHASNQKGLLRKEAGELCVTCHEPVRADAAGSVTHDAVLTGKQCLSCHNPHASSNASMLIADQAAVCQSCHSQPVKAADGRQVAAMPAGKAGNAFVHGPVAAGECATCHSVHGGNYARLLKRINAAALVGKFDTRNYALCFSCHDSELLLSESASDTQFHSGKLNLHRLHLASTNGDRTRSCSTCHVAHAGQRPRLIADTVSYEGSDWQVPMNFVLSPEGGSCAPGCHEPMSYRRDGKQPELKVQQGGTP